MASIVSNLVLRKNILVALNLRFLSTSTIAEPVIETEQGKFKGQVTRNCNDLSYFAFKGIPYAKPPIDEFRFSVTQPPNLWTGIRDATKSCNICAQLCKKTNTLIGHEDCLYLNVYTPQLPSTKNKLLPVMVFIHGGGFLFGRGTDDATHGPDFFMEKEVVMVSINYRLGILGFLSLNLKEAPGNMGLMDQVQALKWIQKNIANFGGNPNNVTIFGSSAGGACVGYLMLSPMAKGLFHKAIAQSGFPLLHWAHNTDVRKLASRIPALHNKTISDDEQLLKYLKSLTANELISASLTVVAADEFRGGIHFGFVPTIEKPGDWKPFLTKSPYQLLAQGEFTKVPYMTGFCTREGLLIMAYGAPNLKKLVKTKKFLNFFPFDLNDNEKPDVENILAMTYLKGETMYNEPDAFGIDFFTDVDVLGGLYQSTKLISKHNKAVYLYEFSYDGNLNYNKKCNNIERKGACHGDETGYMLKSDKLTGPISKTDAIVRDRMTTMWTNFAKYGNPTPKLDHLIPTKWEPITAEGVSCLVIDETIKMKYDVYPHRMKLFEELYDKKYAAK
ncbi:unnamed protein product [Arctia plantaginis]|uniref:Carboxylic ester hydrolase n=1 Tax=Arctia plantaginis TaxID=874455 RepID=A0A8S1BK23_ARCPL|nr:unnamed protein product [Arctia plantaginis]